MDFSESISSTVEEIELCAKVEPYCIQFHEDLFDSCVSFQHNIYSAEIPPSMFSASSSN